VRPSPSGGGDDWGLQTTPGTAKSKNSWVTRVKRVGGGDRQTRKKIRQKEWNNAPFALTSGLVGLGTGSAAAQAASTRSMTDRLIVVRMVMERDVESR